VRADFLGNRRDDFDGETGAVRNGAAIFVSARVGARGEELLDQIGVRAVNLDTRSRLKSINLAFRSCDRTSADHFRNWHIETCRQALKMSASMGRAEVIGLASKRR
jgi:hypothetical protein